MFESITVEMVNGLTDGERTIYEYLLSNVKPKRLVSMLEIQHFSKLAFLLAFRSERTGKSILIAEPLQQIFKEIINSKFISIDTKKKMKMEISDTLLDFNYAAGNHKMASFRLAPFIVK